MAATLQGRYSMGGAKIIHKITGKMKGSSGMWGVQTNYPNTVRVTGHFAPMGELQDHIYAKQVLVSQTADGTDFTCQYLSDMHKVTMECFHQAEWCDLLLDESIPL